jgi:CspA family cold shock protein
MTLGKVTSFDPARGYGFIRAADNPREIFIARSALERSGLSTLSQGQELEYDVGCDGGTLIAKNIRKPGLCSATSARWPL